MSAAAVARARPSPPRPVSHPTRRDQHHPLGSARVLQPLPLAPRPALFTPRPLGFLLPLVPLSRPPTEVPPCPAAAAAVVAVRGGALLTFHPPPPSLAAPPTGEAVRPVLPARVLAATGCRPPSHLPSPSAARAAATVAPFPPPPRPCRGRRRHGPCPPPLATAAGPFCYCGGGGGGGAWARAGGVAVWRRRWSRPRRCGWVSLPATRGGAVRPVGVCVLGVVGRVACPAGGGDGRLQRWEQRHWQDGVVAPFWVRVGVGIERGASTLGAPARVRDVLQWPPRRRAADSAAAPRPPARDGRAVTLLARQAPGAPPVGVAVATPARVWWNVLYSGFSPKRKQDAERPNPAAHVHTLQAAPKGRGRAGSNERPRSATHLPSQK